MGVGLTRGLFWGFLNSAEPRACRQLGASWVPIGLVVKTCRLGRMGKHESRCATRVGVLMGVPAKLAAEVIWVSLFRGIGGLVGVADRGVFWVGVRVGRRRVPWAVLRGRAGAVTGR